jgi:hydrogenase maturation protease
MRMRTIASGEGEQSKSRVLIIGVGNAYRGDDAVGLIVARRLKAYALETDQVTVIEGSGEGAALIESWAGAETVILIDAVCSGTKPGTVYRLEAHAQPVPAEFFRYSTHAFGVTEAIELARALNQLPPRLIVYGVEGKDFQAGTGLSPEVERAVEGVVGRLLRDLAHTPASK